MITPEQQAALQNCHLMYKPTNFILKRNVAYPRLDGSAQVGADPNYVHLVVNEQEEQQYDPRCFVMDKQESDLSQYNYTLEHPLFPHNELSHLLTYNITDKSQKRTLSEIIVHLDNRRKLADSSLEGIPQMSSSYKVIQATRRKTVGLTLTAKEQEILDTYDSISEKFLLNENNYVAIKALIEQGFEPELDAGWEQGT